jgi:recombination protein RecT
MDNKIIQNKAASVAANGERKTIQSYIKAMEGEIKKALPSVLTPERFTRIVLSALSTNPKLGACTPNSFLGAMMNAAQLGLEVNSPLGAAYLIPYKNKGVDEVQFQIGYKGLIDLAYRSGEIEVVQAHIVYANDEFTCEYGLEPKLVHKPALSDRGEAVSVYAMFKTKSGGYGFEVMSMDDVRRHAAKYSQAYNSSFSPWKTSFEEMAKKTCLKKCLKLAPLRSDFVRAVTSDETIKSELSEDMYEVSNEMVYEGEAVEVDETVAAEE